MGQYCSLPAHIFSRQSLLSPVYGYILQFSGQRQKQLTQTLGDSYQFQSASQYSGAWLSIYQIISSYYDVTQYTGDFWDVVPDNGKFIQRKLSREYSQRELFLPDQGNKDFFKTVQIPQKGDIFYINDSTDWRYLLPIILADGHRASLKSGDKIFSFTLIDPNDVFRRKGTRSIFSEYFPQGNYINPWSWSINDSDFQFLYIDGIPIKEWKEYIVEQDYYWAMGDNRDDSLDSRFWGFIPYDYILAFSLLIS